MTTKDKVESMMKSGIPVAGIANTLGISRTRVDQLKHRCEMLDHIHDIGDTAPVSIDMPIEKIHDQITHSVFLKLKRARIDTVRDILERGSDLANVRGLGAKALAIIQDVLADYGFNLEDPV